MVTRSSSARRLALRSLFSGKLTRETMSSLFATNQGTDQPAHPRRLVRAFVFRCFGKYDI